MKDLGIGQRPYPMEKSCVIKAHQIEDAGVPSVPQNHFQRLEVINNGLISVRHQLLELTRSIIPPRECVSKEVPQEPIDTGRISGQIKLAERTLVDIFELTETLLRWQ